jgi:hypothetical protein
MYSNPHLSNMDRAYITGRRFVKLVAHQIPMDARDVPVGFMSIINGVAKSLMTAGRKF